MLQRLFRRLQHLHRRLIRAHLRMQIRVINEEINNLEDLIEWAPLQADFYKARLRALRNAHDAVSTYGPLEMRA